MGHPTEFYNAQPWEIRADMLAGIYREGFTIEAYLRSIAYYEYIESLSNREVLALMTGDMRDFRDHDFSAFEVIKEF